MSILRQALTEGCYAAGVALDSEKTEKLILFAMELNKWNKRINLTAIESDVDMAIKHFVDSIVIKKYIGSPKKLLDIGSGGGFPSIPLRICTEIQEIISVDAVEKKINFQKHMARMLFMAGFKAMHVRGEDLKNDYPDYFEAIVSRAFADIPKFARIALPLLAENGSIIAMKGKNGCLEADAAEEDLHEMGLKVEMVKEYQLPITGDSRSVIIIKRT